MKTPIIILLLLTIPFFCIGQIRLVNINDEDTFWLTKKVEHADFNYAVLDHFDEVILQSEPFDDGGLKLFGPVSGKYTYYQFIKTYNDQQYYFLKDGEQAFLQTHVKVLGHELSDIPIISFREVLILKTDSNRIVLDGCYFTLGVDLKPYSSELFRMRKKGPKLIDGLPTLDLELMTTKFGFDLILQNDDVIRMVQRKSKTNLK